MKRPLQYDLRADVATTLVLGLCLCAGVLSGCRYFPESSFKLAADSRLPRWLTLPRGMSRKDVSVTLSYYAWPTGCSAVFVLYDAKKTQLAKICGTQQGSAPLQLKSPPPGFPPGYPAYELITVEGVTEIIEHRRMEPLFWVTDDPEGERATQCAC